MKRCTPMSCADKCLSSKFHSCSKSSSFYWDHNRFSHGLLPSILGLFSDITSRYWFHWHRVFLSDQVKAWIGGSKVSVLSSHKRGMRSSKNISIFGWMLTAKNVDQFQIVWMGDCITDTPVFCCKSNSLTCSENNRDVRI
jgi:hypothetical protein